MQEFLGWAYRRDFGRRTSNLNRLGRSVQVSLQAALEAADEHPVNVPAKVHVATTLGASIELELHDNLLADSGIYSAAVRGKFGLATQYTKGSDNRIAAYEGEPFTVSMAGMNTNGVVNRILRLDTDRVKGYSIAKAM